MISGLACIVSASVMRARDRPFPSATRSPFKKDALSHRTLYTPLLSAMNKGARVRECTLSRDQNHPT